MREFPEVELIGWDLSPYPSYGNTIILEKIKEKVFMIVVRDTFHLKFGKAKEAKALIKEFNELVTKYDNAPRRFLTDFTGESYRLILESTFENLTSFEKALNSHFGKDDWRAWYDKFIPLVTRSEREILTVGD